MRRIFKKRAVRMMLMAAMVLGLTAAIFSCISGITAVGWSGGIVSDNTLYVGTQGRLEAIDLTMLDSTGYRPVFSQQIKMASPSSGLSCLCGSASAPVAIYGSPVIAGDLGLVFFAGYNGKIYAYKINSINGTNAWEYPRGVDVLKPFVGGLAYSNGVLYIGDSDGNVYALDAKEGVEIWRVAPEDKKKNQKIWATPAIDNNTLYIGSFDKKLYAINITDHSQKWEFTTDGPIMATPVINNGTIYFGSLDRNFYAVNAADGKEKWHITAKNWFWTEPVIVNNTIYVGGLDWNVYLVNPASGSIVNTLKLNGPLSSKPVVADKYVIFVTMTGGTVWKIDTGTQEKINLVTLGCNVDGPVTISGENIYVHGYTGGGCSGVTNIFKRVNLSDGKVTNIPLN
jgi:outer membrane protein assembly factor BamB